MYIYIRIYVLIYIMGIITFIYLKILRMLKPRSEISEFKESVKTRKQSGEEKNLNFSLSFSRI